MALAAPRLALHGFKFLGFVFLGSAFLIAGCGSVPRPFAHSELTPPGPLVDLRGGSGVRVRPLEGVPEKLAAALAKAFAQRLRKANIPATTAATFRSGHVLTGRVEPVEEAPADAPLAHLVWTLRDAGGKLIGSFDQRVRGDPKGWAEIDHKLIEIIARDMGRYLAGLLQDRPLVRAASPIPVFFVKPIAWPSGDGGQPEEGGIVLHNALVHALRRAGAALTDKQSKAGAIIEGSVTIGPERDGARLVSILWRALGADGGEIGKIRQANQVGVTRFNRGWGDLAHAAAGGAATGIADLLDRAAAAGK